VESCAIATPSVQVTGKTTPSGPAVAPWRGSLSSEARSSARRLFWTGVALSPYPRNSSFFSSSPSRDTPFLLCAALSLRPPFPSRLTPPNTMSPSAATFKRESNTARVLGAGCAGISELMIFHPVDTTAKRLMSNVGKV